MRFAGLRGIYEEMHPCFPNFVQIIFKLLIIGDSVIYPSNMFLRSTTLIHTKST